MKMNPTEIITTSTRKLTRKWSIAIKIAPILVLIGVVKFFVHIYEFEIMELNALFSSLIGGTIFLIGFLISGVLSDYKESEKIPSEMTGSMKTLYDDTYTIYKTKNSATALEFIAYQKKFVDHLMDWFYKRIETKDILLKIENMNDFFVEFDKEGVQAGYIVRLKNEQMNLRKLILRTETIRETDFVGSAYTILEAMGFLIAVGLIIIKIDPFYAGLFFTLLVTFLILYMFLLIKDLDDPFDYASNGEGGTEVSLKPIKDLQIAFAEMQRN
ncbi:MAG: hypothetical protein IT222_11210 [Crocinitomix sp.]|nr:hypothetical protein [Crocinitomix sp.]